MNTLVVCPICSSHNTTSSSTCRACGATFPAPVVPSELPIGSLLRQGKYRVVKLLGRGGFGITYKAESPRGFVAIKELYPDGLVIRDATGQVSANPGEELEFDRLKARFEVEADVLLSLRHRSATQILAWFEEHGTRYIVMEFIEGETLEARIKRGPLNEEEVLGILVPILEVLQEVHSKRLLHRDIKPANIILTPTHAELLDFGSIIKFQTNARTNVRQRFLTPDYAPLEQFGGNVQLGPQTDLYALGATLYEAITGVRPPSSLERSQGIQLRPLFKIAPKFDLELAGLIERMLEMRIEDRPQIDEICKRIEQVCKKNGYVVSDHKVKNSRNKTKNPYYVDEIRKDLTRNEIAWNLFWNYLTIGIVITSTLIENYLIREKSRYFGYGGTLPGSLGFFFISLVNQLLLYSSVAAFLLIPLASGLLWSGFVQVIRKANFNTILFLVYVAFLCGNFSIIAGFAAFWIALTLTLVVLHLSN